MWNAKEITRINPKYAPNMAGRVGYGNTTLDANFKIHGPTADQFGMLAVVGTGDSA